MTRARSRCFSIDFSPASYVSKDLTPAQLQPTIPSLRVR